MSTDFCKMRLSNFFEGKWYGRDDIWHIVLDGMCVLKTPKYCSVTGENSNCGTVIKKLGRGEGGGYSLLLICMTPNYYIT
jgi:hypothetical protein